MEKLDEMFEKQRELQEKLGTFKNIAGKYSRQQFINEMLLACYSELAEMQSETMWKDHELPFGWKIQSFSEQKYKEEIIDLWHFIMNLWLAVGGTSEEFYQLYCEKNQVNHDRQEKGY